MPMSEANRKAAGERLRAAREKKKAEQVAQAEVTTEAPAEQPGEVAALRQQVAEMAAQMQELINMNQGNASATPEAKLAEMIRLSGVQVGAGGVQGLQYKYPVEKSHYPDPTEELYDEPTLKRFAMRENYLFRWDVEGVTYEKYNITYSEPLFKCELFRKMFDEEGLETGRLIFVARIFLTEDDLYARMAAEKLGITDQFTTQDELMNAIRFERIKSWLLGIFKPYKIEEHKNVPQMMVIDGKAVEVHDSEVLVSDDGAVTKASVIQSEVRI